MGPVGQHEEAGVLDGRGQRGVVAGDLLEPPDVGANRGESLLRGGVGGLTGLELAGLGLQGADALAGLPGGVGKGGGQDGEVGPAGAGEDAGQRVVVVGGDRVELVVVAAGAGDRQPQEGAGDGVDALLPLLGDDVLDDVLVELEFLPVGGTELDFCNDT
jgi:hypothetical protein